MRFTWDVMVLWTRHLWGTYPYYRGQQGRDYYSGGRVRAAWASFARATHDALMCIAMRRAVNRMDREGAGDD